MTSTASMIDRHPRRPRVDTSLQGDTIEILVEAARTAQQCASACLHQQAPSRRSISVALDVADLAGTTANMLVRLSEPSALLSVLDACRATLRACAEVCRSEGAYLQACAICAATCERAEDHCIRMTAAVGHLVADGGRAATPLSG